MIHLCRKSALGAWRLRCAGPLGRCLLFGRLKTQRGGSSSIRRLEAKGNVVVTQKDQVVTGETAVFDTKANMITMLGGIVLTQGKNVLRGDRLMVDMATGVSRVESDSGRVQGLFISSGGGGGAPAIPGMPGSTPAPAPSSSPSNKPK